MQSRATRLYVVEPPLPVEKIEIRNFGCIRDVKLSLTRLHALIGPNDSGKSTILRAIREAQPMTVHSGALLQVVEGGWVAGEWQLVDHEGVLDRHVRSVMEERGDVPILRLIPTHCGPPAG
jgi:ABC-type polar amino acid transport system ATPase subunit